MWEALESVPKTKTEKEKGKMNKCTGELKPATSKLVGFLKMKILRLDFKTKLCFIYFQ